MENILVNDCRSRWLSQAKFDARKHISLRYQKGRGTCVLLILDFSESMQGEGIRSLKRGVSDILNECLNHPELDENVAVIVFGEETKFLHYYSNQYAAIKQNIEDLEPRGASPLTAAFLLSLGGLYEGSAHTQKIGEYLVPPRVVVFTDGRFTNFANEGARDDEAERHPSDLMLAHLFAATHQIGRGHPIFCFPVGDSPNYSLLHEISMRSKGGKVLEIHRARWFGKYALHYIGADIAYKITNKTVVDKEVLQVVVVSSMSWSSCEEEDLDTIRELLNNRAKIMVDQEKAEEDPEDEVYKEKYDMIPKLGTRVRRGPHWTFENQDSEGVGTIIGHGEPAGKVYVEWDTGIRCQYSHGQGSIYNIVACDEPRIPEDGFPAVGCYVKRGPDWKWEDQDGGIGSIGSVYRIKDDATVYVRWPCGRRSNYRFGYDGKFDIEVCDPFSVEVVKAVREQQRGAQCFDADEKRCNDLKEKNSVEETGTKDSKLRGSTKDFNLPSDSRKLKGTKANSTSYVDKSSLLKQNSRGKRKSVSNVRAEDHFSETDDNDIQTDSVSEHPRDVSQKGIFGNRTDTSKSDLKAAPEHSGFCWDVDEALDNPDEFLNVLSPKGKCIPLKRKSTVFDNNVTSCPQHDAVHLLHGDFQKTAQERSTDDTVSRSVHSRHCSDDLNHSWQWLDGNGTWIYYPESVNSQINRRLLQRPTASVVVEYNEQIFRIVASKMIQINTESKEKHEIRRKIFR
eukprot:XP_011440026.1 PREDICTED: uncharacterized protein LOC105337132 [Crassostrea gigas]